MTENDLDKLISAAMVNISEKQDAVKTDEDLEAIGIPEHQFSAEFEEKMSRIMKSELPKAKRTHRHGGKIVAAIIVCLFISGTVVCSVEAIRIPVINFLLNLDASNSNIIASDEAYSKISPDFQSALPSYIPEGFVISRKEEYPDDYISIEYANGEGLYYDLTCSLYIESNAIDTEDSTYETVTLNGRKAYFCEKKGRVLAVCYSDDCTYLISGNITQDEIEKIFSSI